MGRDQGLRRFLYRVGSSKDNSDGGSKAEMGERDGEMGAGGWAKSHQKGGIKS